MAQQETERQPERKDDQGAVTRWALWARERRDLLRRIGLAFSFLIIAVSTIIFGRIILGIDPHRFKAAFAAIGYDQLAMSMGLACVSYLALTGYDALALRHLHVRVPYSLTALASFTSYAISFTLGFPLVTGGAVRYWLYSQAGLSAGKVASLTIVAGVTFWLGMGVVLGAGFVFDPSEIGEINNLAAVFNQAIGVALFAALFAYLVWVTRLRRRGRGLFLNFRLPGPLLTLGQTSLGIIDVCSAAGALYVLLPQGHALSYLAFCSLYSFGAMLGIASHSPGGLGVFEATMLKGVGGSSDQLLASLLMFRVIYYLIPFVLALALLGANEAMRRWRSLREAMSTTEFNDED